MSIDFLRSEWAYITGAFVTLFFIIDPFAVVPLYLTLTNKLKPRDIEHVRRKATLIALGMLMLFAIAGMRVFQLFGITLPAFQIAGGLLLLLLGIAQLNATSEKVNAEETDESLERDDVSVFPLATPMLAGPGAISTVILYSTEATSALRLIELLVAIGGCMLAAYLVLRASPALLRVLGRTGLNLLSRVMGLVLTAIAVQFILNGLGEALKTMR